MPRPFFSAASSFVSEIEAEAGRRSRGVRPGAHLLNDPGFEDQQQMMIRFET